MVNLWQKIRKTGRVAEPPPPKEDGAVPEPAAAAAAELGGSVQIRHVDAGSCNGCELEIASAFGPVYDAERYGARLVASPRHADALLVTGPVTRNMEVALRRTHEAVPRPRLVIALGDCARNCGVFAGAYGVAGAVGDVVPVDVEGPGCPPVRVAGPLLGGITRVDAALSSQFLSALLLALPLAPSDSRIDLIGSLPARPYVDMTVRMIAAYGAEPPVEEQGRWLVRGGQAYRGRRYSVEPDASSASYFLAAAALTGGRVTVPGVGSGSLQGDAAFVEVLRAMGCGVAQDETATTVEGPADGRLRAVDVDLNAMSDLTPTVAVLAPFADGPVRIRNVGHIRVQESDRLQALAAELGRLGVPVEETADGLTIHPARPRPGRVRTYDDHRLAMAFSVLALRVPGLEIDDPGCAAKTFPDFYRRLELLGARVRFA